MASDIWLRTILIVRKETRKRHIGYSYRLTARVLLYAPSHRQDNTYHGLCYTSRGALAGTRNSSMGPPHEGSIRRPIAPWANALTTELHLARRFKWTYVNTQTFAHISRIGVACTCLWIPNSVFVSSMAPGASSTLLHLFVLPATLRDSTSHCLCLNTLFFRIQIQLECQNMDLTCSRWFLDEFRATLVKKKKMLSV